MTNTKITIKRDSGYADRFRSYQVIVDGETIGSIADGQSKSFSIKPGAHTLRLKIDWGKSNDVVFTAVRDKTTHFICASRARGVKVLLAVIYATILSQRYIKLERID